MENTFLIWKSTDLLPQFLAKLRACSRNLPIFLLFEVSTESAQIRSWIELDPLDEWNKSDLTQVENRPIHINIFNLFWPILYSVNLMTHTSNQYGWEWFKTDSKNNRFSSRFHEPITGHHSHRYRLGSCINRFLPYVFFLTFEHTYSFYGHWDIFKFVFIFSWLLIFNYDFIRNILNL